MNCPVKYCEVSELSREKDILSGRKIFYIVVSNIFIKKVALISAEGERCLVRLTDTGGGMRIGRSRLFATEAEAQNSIKRRSGRIKRAGIDPMGPYAYAH